RTATRAMGDRDTGSPGPDCDEPHRFAWVVGDPENPSATWRFTLKPDGTGTRLEQWYQMGPARSGLNIAIDAMPDKEQKIVFVRLREHEEAMLHNLDEIKTRAERWVRTAPTNEASAGRDAGRVGPAAGKLRRD